MTVDRALRALRERWAMVVLCVLLGLLGAAGATYLMPRLYSADVTLYVTLQGQAESSEDAFQANRLAQERALSYAPLLTDERVTQAVIEQLGLEMTPGELAGRITATVHPETTVLTADVQDTTPQGAADIANAVAAEFSGLVGELEQPIGPTPPPPPPGEPAVNPSRIGIEIIRAATPQDTLVSPNVPFNLALGAALGLLIGVAAVVVRDARDPSIRSAERLHKLTRAPVLTEIAYDRRVTTRPLTVDEPYASPRAEAFRKLRTNLQFRDGRRGHRVVVVTSPGVGQGTSTTACNLAAALAEAGNRVLLIDANLRSPKVADYLGVDPIPGLVDVLAARMVWPYARKRWNRGALDVLPAGPYPHTHSQLLASYNLADLLTDMRNHYDFVIVDTPALLAVSDAAAVAARADGVILVVQHRHTTQEQVTSATEALNAVSARLVGTVLTMTRGRLRRDAQVPSYQAPGPRAGQDMPTLPAAAPAPDTSPPADEPRAVPEEAGGPGEDAQQERGDETTPAAVPVDGSSWRPSPTPRS